MLCWHRCSFLAGEVRQETELLGGPDFGGFRIQTYRLRLVVVGIFTADISELQVLVGSEVLEKGFEGVAAALPPRL